jgi:signal transduction histidine kinase
VAESLTNVVRHAGADHCVVRLQRADGHLRIRVTDDGSGLGSGSGHGLDSMQRRAADVGGLLDVGPDEPRGTVVTAVLPLESPA